MAELASQSISIQSVYTWYREGKLFVNRRYQRKLVWTQEEKQKLIGSILKKFPIPAILIAERDGATGTYEIIQMTPHDEWDYDGVNEMILADQNIGGTNRRILVHFDRNGFGYTLDRANGELLVAEKYDPTVNWATKVDMDKNSKTYGRPLVVLLR